MGLTITVRFRESPPPWAEVAAHLAGKGVPVGMRMIDGQLAFPDEQPAEPWRELRVAVPGGMVTMHRREDRVDLVVWGNADAALRRGWLALAQAWAAVGGGTVEGADALDAP